MQLDIELYRYSIAVSSSPRVRISVIDINPQAPKHIIVFLHGFGGHAVQFAYQLQDFAARSRVIALDHRGHGKSDAPVGGYSMPRIVADLEIVLDRLGVHGPVVLVGHSFGGAVALEFAVKNPSRLSHLVLIAVSGEFRVGGRERLGLGLPLPVMRAVEPLTRGWVHARPHALKAWHQHIMAPWNGWDLMTRVRTPTLVMLGSRDRVFPKAVFEQVAGAIPNAEEIDVGASGHMVHLERRDAVNRAIEGFINSRRQSWRETTRPGTLDRSELPEKRPWLKEYEDGVPYTIAVPNVPVQQLLRSAVRRFPRNPAVVFGDRRLTYRQLNHEANRLANALLALGLEPGDRVFIDLPNRPETIVAFFGILKAGGVAVLSPSEDDEFRTLQIADSGARVVLVDRALEALDTVDHFVRHAVQLDRVHLLRTVESHNYRALVRPQARTSPDIAVDPSETAVIIYTGGTTAAPRGVRLSHRNLLANATQTRHWLPDLVPGQERVLNVLPYTHSYGLMTGLILPVALAATIVLRPDFQPADALQAIKAHRPTLFPGSPRVYLALANFPGVRGYGVDSIRACLSGSDPLPVEVQEQFEKLTRGRLIEGYGLTEASPVTHVNPLSGQRRTGSIGLPLPSTEARIVDLKTGMQEVEPGHLGELQVRGPQVMLGYWKDPEQTARVLDEKGWLRTGDVAVMDEDGYFRIVARKADMWITEQGGEPAFPRDVEEVLYEIPNVQEAAVVGIARQPVGFVIPRLKTLTQEEVIEYCRRRLPPELVPRLIVFVEDFPRTFIGKILRRELAKRFEEQQASSQKG